MKFTIDKAASNPDKFKACERLFTTVGRLDSAEYLEGDGEVRGKIREDVFASAIPVLGPRTYSKWLDDWFHLDNEVKPDEKAVGQINRIFDFVILNTRYWDQTYLESVKKHTIKNLDTGSFSPYFIKTLKEFSNKAKAQGMDEDLAPLFEFISEVENNPRYKKAVEFTLFQSGKMGLLDDKQEYDANKKAAESEKARQSVIDAIKVKKPVIYVENPLTEKIKEVREKYKDSASLTTAEVFEVGEIVFAEFNKIEFANESELVQKRNEIATKYRKTAKNLEATEREQLYAQYEDVVKQINTSRVKNAEESKKYLATIRPLWNGETKRLNTLCGGRSVPGKTIHEAMRMLPTEIAEIQLLRPGLTAKHTRSRGCYSNSGDIVKTDCTQTSVHELGHRLEHLHPTVLELERQFYEKRTQGQYLQSLRKLTGGNYRPNEKAIADHFLHPYMGKTYNGRAYELISMGFEYFYFHPAELKKDPDYAKFILGILTTL